MASRQLLPVRNGAVSGTLANVAFSLIIVVGIVWIIYVGKELLQPLVIAALIAFILTPLIRKLRSVGVWRTPSILMSVALALGLIAALSWVIARQITQLASELPRYESNLRTKVRALSGSPFASGALERASGTLRELQDEISKQPSQSSNARPEQRPIPVEVRQPEQRGLEALANLVRPLLSPLTTTALAILFLLFLLLQREDIRDRFLRLVGTSDMHRTTAALDDAAARLSRFFVMQTLLNAGFGVVIGIGLWILGVPNAVLWGILAGLMRFVPFIGSFIAAVFPILLAAAVDPGWSLVAWTAALFIISEPLAGHVIEPLVYGQHTGLSPVAIVLATLFWSMLWGPIGLLLATPLTVCLVVLGRHIEPLQFIEVLLGDAPALAPEESFYQRLLASDATEAADQIEQSLKGQSLIEGYDAIAMKALVLAQSDAAREKLDSEQQTDLRDTVGKVTRLLEEHAPPEAGEIAVSEAPSRAAEPMKPVLCVASRSAIDEAACSLLAQLLEARGIPARVVSFGEIINGGLKEADSNVVVLSYFGSASRPAHVRYLIRRLKQRLPNARYLAGFWMLAGTADKAADWRDAVGADEVQTTLANMVAACSPDMDQLSPPATPPLQQAAQ